MAAAQFFDQIRELIARDELKTALTQLRLLLENSPKLDEVILQSARFSDIRRQIRLGLVSDKEANLTQNQIRTGLLELLREIETQGATPTLQKEIEQAITIVNSAQVQGNNNIIIQGATDSTITVNVNGETQEIHRRLDDLQALLEKLQVNTIQTADKIYNIGSITNANFEYIVGQSKQDRTLPEDLAQNLVTDENIWVKSLQQELLKQGVSVGNKPWAIFQHYGWLIEAFLQKMGTEAGRERSLRRLAFMAEAYQGTLRYLCYIQLSQIFHRRSANGNPTIAGFIRMDADKQPRYDYLNLLLLTTELLPRGQSFMPELHDFTAELTDTHSDLHGTALFLEKYRSALLDGRAPDGEALDHLLDEYLTGLVYWLRRLAFLAKYRLVSIKDISLNYRLGTEKNFVHLYGELHGMYAEAMSDGEDYSAHSIEGVFTFNQSVLLFRGSNMADCLDRIHKPDTYISLSPLVVDQSVFADKATQTPEIYYYIGQDKSGRQYLFAQYKNELEYEGRPIPSNKRMIVKAQNIQMPRLDELFGQLEQVFQPFKTAAR
jgi:hypothetical protein